jgi:hypothetical protein
MNTKYKLTFLLSMSGIFLLFPLGTFSAKEKETTGLAQKPAFEEVYKKLDAQVRAALQKDKTEGIKELERVGEMLSKDYPEEFMPYAMLSAVASMTPDQEKSVKILKKLAALDDSDPKIARIVGKAKSQLKKREALGKPLDMKFTAVDGREVDLSQMKGKVILIDFWATWCGPSPVFARYQVLKGLTMNCISRASRSLEYPWTVRRRSSRAFWQKMKCPGPNFSTEKAGRPAWPRSMV